MSNEKLRQEWAEERKIELKYNRIINTSVNRVMELMYLVRQLLQTLTV